MKKKHIWSSDRGCFKRVGLHDAAHFVVAVENLNPKRIVCWLRVVFPWCCMPECLKPPPHPFVTQVSAFFSSRTETERTKLGLHQQLSAKANGISGRKVWFWGLVVKVPWSCCFNWKSDFLQWTNAAEWIGSARETPLDIDELNEVKAPSLSNF